MATYITLYKWTEQGIRNVKDTVQRVEQARSAMQRFGGRLIAIYWTQGAYDLVGIAEFGDEESATAMALALAMQGNVRSETLRAFNEEEMGRILQKLG